MRPALAGRDPTSVMVSFCNVLLSVQIWVSLLLFAERDVVSSQQNKEED